MHHVINLISNQQVALQLFSFTSFIYFLKLQLIYVDFIENYVIGSIHGEWPANSSCMQYACTFALVLKNFLSIISDAKYLTERHRLYVVFEIMLISSYPMLILACQSVLTKRKIGSNCSGFPGHGSNGSVTHFFFEFWNQSQRRFLEDFHTHHFEFWTFLSFEEKEEELCFCFQWAVPWIRTCVMAWTLPSLRVYCKDVTSQVALVIISYRFSLWR